MAGFEHISLNEADRLLPEATVLRMIRKSLPNGCKISSEVKERMLEITSELVGFVTNHAVEKYMVTSKRKTLLKEDMLNAVDDLDLSIFVPPLKEYETQKNKQKMSSKSKRNNKIKSVNSNLQQNTTQSDI
eukprot:266744_1